MLTAVLIFLGGGAGALLRWSVGVLALRLGETRFPVATLAVNITGCLLIGLVAGLGAARALHLRDDLRLMLTVGFLGGLTTFSTFGLETVTLVRGGHPGLALANVLASNAAGLAAVYLGFRLGGGTMSAG